MESGYVVAWTVVLMEAGVNRIRLSVIGMVGGLVESGPLHRRRFRNLCYVWLGAVGRSWMFVCAEEAGQR